AQVGGDRQSVGPGTNNGDFRTTVHSYPPTVAHLASDGTGGCLSGVSTVPVKPTFDQIAAHVLQRGSSSTHARIRSGSSHGTSWYAVRRNGLPGSLSHSCGK